LTPQAGQIDEEVAPYDDDEDVEEDGDGGDEDEDDIADGSAKDVGIQRDPDALTSVREFAQR